MLRRRRGVPSKFVKHHDSSANTIWSANCPPISDSNSALTQTSSYIAVCVVVRFALTVTHQGLVLTELRERVLPEPAGTAEILEACLFTAEEWSSLCVTETTERVFKIGVNLNLKRGNNIKFLISQWKKSCKFQLRKTDPIFDKICTEVDC